MIVAARCRPRGGRGNPFATKPQKPPMNLPDRRRNGAESSPVVSALGGGFICSMKHRHATSSSDQNLAQVKKLGAVAGVNYRTHPNWEEEILKLTGGQGFDGLRHRLLRYRWSTLPPGWCPSVRSCSWISLPRRSQRFRSSISSHPATRYGRQSPARLVARARQTAADRYFMLINPPHLPHHDPAGRP